ncbi:MAG: alpha/beta fold hydrolase [Pseudomonadales bacterium]
MRQLIMVLLIAVCAFILLPFIGPALGLASFQDLAEPAGRSVAVSAGTINVHDHEGSRRAVILIHGNPGSAQMMRPLAQALNSLGYRVVRYDRMGWGHSGQRPAHQPANPTAHAQDLIDLVTALEIAHPLYVGYSYGGGVLMEANRMAPALVGDLVFLNSVAKRRVRPTSALERALTSPLVMRWVLGTNWTAEQAATALEDILMSPETPPEREISELLASLALPNVPSHWQREDSERHVEFETYRPELVQGCALIVHGDSDQVNPPALAQHLIDSIVGARLAMIAGGGHGMVLTQAQLIAQNVDQHAKHCDEISTRRPHS